MMALGQPAGGARGRFDLVTLDLDGTLLPDDTAFAVILRHNGFADEVAASDARFFAGEQDLEVTFWEQWQWVSTLSLADMHRALRKAAWLPDIDEAVGRLRTAGLRVCVLTDQPSTVTDFLGRWDLTEAVCSPVEVRDGRQLAIDARFDKLANLRERLAAWGIPADRACHVGNGANDVPVWGAVGAGVAAFAPSDIAARADVDLGRPASLHDVVDAVLALHRRDRPDARAPP